MAITTLSAERSTTHRSLQVINEVKSVVRELVENAIDAGAGNIVVKLVDNGATVVQVTDNGRGIHESNFEQLALPNTTSKIQQFEDIFNSLSTHGFRGEALNCIANVGILEVETRTPDDDMGWALKFGQDGSLIDKTQIATNIGTTVICRHLFDPYPVRRAMVLKGIKNSVSGSVSLVQQYALIHPEIRFALTNMTSSTHQMRSLFTSPGTCKTIREVSEKIFGHSFIKNVVDVDIRTEGWSMEGVISTPQTGRQSNDIQILFVNRRPIDEMKKIKRCLKDVHRQFSSKHNVAYVLNLTIDYNNVDINLAPDKRRLFLLQEEIIMQQLKERIVELYLMIMAKVSLNSDPLQRKQVQFANSCTSAAADNTQKMEQRPEIHNARSNYTVQIANVDTSYEADIMYSDNGRTQLQRITSTDPATEMASQRTQSEDNDNLSQSPDETDTFLASCISKVHVGSQDCITAVGNQEDATKLGTVLNNCMTTVPSEEQTHDPQSNNNSSTQSSVGTSDKLITGVDIDLMSLFRDVNRDLAVNMGMVVVDNMSEDTTNIRPEEGETIRHDNDNIEDYVTPCQEEVNMGFENLRNMDLTEFAYTGLRDGQRQWTLEEYIASTRTMDVFSNQDTFRSVETSNEDVVDSPTHQQQQQQQQHSHHLGDGVPHPVGIFDASPRISVETGYNSDSKVVPMQVDTESSKSMLASSEDGRDICNDDVLAIDMDRLYDDNLCTIITERNVKSNYYSSRVPTLTDYGMMDPKVFLNMKVCGQFNNGFIIAKLEGTEFDTEEIKYSMYLIDPHAADEKTKFELYNDIIKIVKQPLVCPRKIDLSPFHQQVVEANLDLLKENGFDAYLVHKTEDTGDANAESSEPGVYLSTLPQLLGHILGEEDFISFVHDLAKNETSAHTALNNTESYKVLWGGKAILPRPRRIWNILASRACKKAVKLGEPLSMNQMEAIKDGLASLIHPWNCPHGRPTMKCLITTEQLKNIIS